MTTLRRILLARLVIGLSACASAPPDTPKASRILIVSLLGNTLMLHQVGMTVFGNVQQTMNVSEWNVDANVEEFAKTILSEADRQIVEDPKHAPAEVGSLSYVGFTQTYSFVNGPDGLKKVAARANADYVVLVTEFPQGGDPFFRTNQSITGYGVYQRRGVGNISYANIRTLLVSGKSGDIITFQSAARSIPRGGDLWLDLEKSQTTVDLLR